jgi:separase
LFIYCGHGGGEQLCDGLRLRRFYCPSAWLWGCSSGHLIKRGIHDPIGIAVSYLLSGAIHVVGALWDVTDRDLDRLSAEYMKIRLENEKNSQNESEILVHARKICKMKFAVGSSCVIYGLD